MSYNFIKGFKSNLKIDSKVKERILQSQFQKHQVKGWIFRKEHLFQLTFWKCISLYRVHQNRHKIVKRVVTKGNNLAIISWYLDLCITYTLIITISYLCLTLMKAALSVWAADRFTRSSCNKNFKSKLISIFLEKATFLIFHSMVSTLIHIIKLTKVFAN